MRVQNHVSCLKLMVVILLSIALLFGMVESSKNDNQYVIRLRLHRRLAALGAFDPPMVPRPSPPPIPNPPISPLSPLSSPN